MGKNECKHYQTKINNLGICCYTCGTQLYLNNKNFCKDCLYFRKPILDVPYCAKKLMGVSSDFIASYPYGKETCFVENNKELNNE